MVLALRLRRLVALNESLMVACEKGEDEMMKQLQHGKEHPLRVIANLADLDKQQPLDADKIAFREAAKDAWKVWEDNQAVEAFPMAESEAIRKRLRMNKEVGKILTPRFVFTDKHSGLRHMLLIWTASHNKFVKGEKDAWRLVSADVKSAFLKGDPYMAGDRELYMENMKDSETSDAPGLPFGRALAKIRKGVFGLSDAPRQWYLRLNRALLEQGWERSPMDYACWLLWSEDKSTLDGVIVSHDMDESYLHRILASGRWCYTVNQAYVKQGKPGRKQIALNSSPATLDGEPLNEALPVFAFLQQLAESPGWRQKGDAVTHALLSNPARVLISIFTDTHANQNFEPCRKDKPLHKFTDVGKSKVILNVFPLVNTWEPPRNVTLDYSLSDKRRNFLKDRFPLLTVTVTVTRFPWYHLWNISLPLGSIVVMSWSSFTIDAADKAGRLSASLTLVLTAVAYKYIVAQMVPHISYNTLLDKYILTCWLFLFLVVIENCFAEQVQDEIAVALTFGISFLLYNICFWTYGCMVYQARNVRQSDIDMNLDDSSDDSDEETQC
ncbi:Cys-loop ligand-gated ion channel (ELIC) [Durusdinium trenchii]|uniref:Cys-loop ligand-gated ion channel (ELIC) n=1 Tax=Durusdinium trenchii TaxID=1381693 RepID=A0ABP0NW81_9DINO